MSRYKAGDRVRIREHDYWKMVGKVGRIVEVPDFGLAWVGPVKDGGPELSPGDAREETCWVLVDGMKDPVMCFGGDLEPVPCR